MVTLNPIERTGISDLREEIENLNALICEVFFATPIADNGLSKQLMRSYSSLVDLLEALQNYA